jgi:hypothetical protein
MSKSNFFSVMDEPVVRNDLMTTLKIPPQEAIQQLTERIESIPALMAQGCDAGYYDMLKWCSKTWTTIDEIFGGGDYRCDEIRLIGAPACACCAPGALPAQLEVYHATLMQYIDQIRAGMPERELP